MFAKKDEHLRLMFWTVIFLYFILVMEKYSSERG